MAVWYRCTLKHAALDIQGLVIHDFFSLHSQLVLNKPDVILRIYSTINFLACYFAELPLTLAKLKRSILKLSPPYKTKNLLRKVIVG
jgi:hypothetical protein